MGFTNLSLQYNTVSFYQACLCLTIPIVFSVNRFAFNKTHSSNVTISCGLITIGVLFIIISNLQVTISGSLFGVVAALTSSLYQLVIHKMIEESENPMHIMFYQSPLA